MCRSKSPTLGLSHLGCIINIHLCPITSRHQHQHQHQHQAAARFNWAKMRSCARPSPGHHHHRRSSEMFSVQTQRSAAQPRDRAGCIPLSRYNHIAINIQGNMRERICLIMTCKTSFICFTRKVSVFVHAYRFHMYLLPQIINQH